MLIYFLNITLLGFHKESKCMKSLRALRYHLFELYFIDCFSFHNAKPKWIAAPREHNKA